MVLATVLISAVDQAQHPSRRRVQALAYQERIATLSQGHLQCAEGYEVHHLPQGQLLYFQRGNGDLPVQVLAHQAWL